MSSKAEATRAAGFKEGARVARVRNWYDLGLKYAGVENIGRVLNNGNFTIEGDPGKQQYRRGLDNWARATGDRWSRGSVRLVTPEIEAEIKTDLARAGRLRRLARVAAAVETFQKERDVPEAVLAAVEAALGTGGGK